MAIRRIRDWFRRMLGRRRTPPVLEAPTLEPEEWVVPKSFAAEKESGTTDSTKTSRSQVVTKRSAAEEPFLQFPRRRKTGQTDIVIGLDFGTSSSKVVLRSPYKLGGRAMAVPYADLGYSRCRYLLPTRVFVGPEGQIELNGRSGWQAEWDLKVRMLNKVSAISQNADHQQNAKRFHALSAAYLAHVLRETRRWFLNTQGDIYESDEIRWSLNLGIPSAGYDDHRVRKEFAAMAHAAWLLSIAREPLCLDRATEVMERVLSASSSRQEPQSNGAGIPVSVIPEVTAQVLGYGKSHEREQGLHVLIDVGASTLDISSFVVHVIDEEDRYPMLTADTVRLGLLVLQQERMATVQYHPPLDSLPEDLIGPMPHWKDAVSDAAMAGCLKRCDDEFLNRWIRRLNKTLIDLRNRRDPNSPRWKDGLPVFGCGGGSGSQLFEEFAHRADREFRNGWTTAGLRVRRLPVPKSLVAGAEPLERDVFSRLSVAYGLSYDAINIPKTEPPGDIEDIRAVGKARDYRERFIGPEQV